MRGNDKRKKLLFSVLSGVIAALVIFMMFNSMDKKLDSQTQIINKQSLTIENLKKLSTINNQYDYLIASKPLKKGEKIKPIDISKQIFQMKVAGAISDYSLVVDKTLLTDLKAGDLITVNMIPGVSNLNSDYIPSGMRLVTIPSVSIQGLATYFKPGTKVDVVSIAKNDTMDSNIIIQNVRIISLESKTPSPQQTTPAGDLAAITLLIPVQSTAKLIEAFTLGKIQLVARGVNDEGFLNRRVTSRRKFTKIDKNLPSITSIPSKLPAPAMPMPVKNTQKVEMIQAGSKSEVTFE
ncbi:MAG: Flp pilus assembly protein CpaB [Candidatus Gastranaerophilaceae bacterium]|jgi:Flp pilus assembly protein CpaB